MRCRWYAGVVLCLIAGIGHGAEAPAKFLLAYGAIGGNALPLWIAKEQGIFRKYNLDPQLIYIIAGRAMQSMLAGDVPVGLLGATHVTNAVTAGGDMTMLLGLEEKLNFALVVRPGIRTAEDLKGKPCPSLPGIASVLKLMAQHGLNARAAELKPQDIADLSLCQRLDEAGFFDRVYQ